MQPNAYRHFLFVSLLGLGACATPQKTPTTSTPATDGHPTLSHNNAAGSNANLISTVHCNEQVDADLLYARGYQLYQTGSAAAMQKASQCFELAAGKGDNQARCVLATMYTQGQGVPVDAIAALHHWREASKQNMACGENGLGNAYTEGYGVKPSAAEAQRWYLRAAQHGFGNAQLVQARYHEKRRDLLSAYAWASVAVEYGEGSAAAVRDDLAQRLNKRQQKQAPTKLSQIQRQITPLEEVKKAARQRKVLELLGHVDRYFPARYAGLTQQQRIAKTAGWMDTAIANGFNTTRTLTFYLNTIGFLGEDAVNGSGKWPDIDRILANKSLTPAERIEQAAIKAEALLLQKKR
ncbi:tetratricopeptide repeat protein [Chitinimonas sp. PSY-7]|uniref:tetratricopeptide repeat protein n=1 Tax=Chitinimonas sp. PSY-7 TaxID=3459088 RepID=UPI00404038E2